MNKLIYNILFVVILLGSFVESFNLQAQPKMQKNASREVKNLTVFAKSYGYIRFFYPNIQTENFNWNAFLMYGVQQVRNLKTDEELKGKLSDLFASIAPYTMFSNYEKRDLKLKSISQGDSITFWQHSSFSIGENLGVKSEGNDLKILVTTEFDSTKTIQVNSPFLKDDVQFEFIDYLNFNKYFYPENFRPLKLSTEIILEKHPDPSETFSYKLTDNLWITMPIVLSNQEAKHLAQKAQIEEFSSMLEQYYSEKKLHYQEEDIWYADFILVWNAFHHLYPYRKRSEEKFKFQSSDQLKIGLNDIFNSKDKKTSSLKVIKHYVSLFQDGHANVTRPQTQDENGNKTKAVQSWLPFYRIYSQGKVYVLRSFDPKIKSGDEVLEINGKEASVLIDSKIKNEVASPQLNLWNAVNTIGALVNAPKAEVKLKRDDEVVTIEVNTISQKDYFQHFRNPFEHEPFEYPKPGTIYINPSFVSSKDLYDKLDELLQAEHLIIDLRVYPNSLKAIFDHLQVGQGLGKGLIISSPLNMYPNQDQKFHIWQSALTIPKQPHIKAKISVLVSSATMSRGETFASYLKYAGSTLIGDGNTAGASGGINWFTTLAGTKIWLTTSYAVRQNGEEMQSIGITPDILVKYSLEGLKKGRDQLYEAALKTENNQYLKNIDKGQ